MSDFKKNILNPAHWVRLVFMVIFTFGLYLLFFLILLILIVIQFIYALITGLPNKNLTQASKIFASYIMQIINYLTYNSDEKPWPFNDIELNDDTD